MYLSEDIKKIIVKFLNEKIKCEFIYLFGSFAKGEGREDSDIDLAIYTNDNINEYELFMFSNNLASKINRDVQIVNLKEIDTVFAAQIVGYREELYSRDDIIKGTYNMRTFKDYAKLNEERKVVIDAIERDGRIYG